MKRIMKVKSTYLLVCFIVSFMLINLTPSLLKAACKEGESFIELAEKTDNFNVKIKNYFLALEKCPDDIEILTAMIDLYIKNENYDDAYGVAYRMISINKYGAGGLCKLAYIYMMREEYDKAEETVKKVLTINDFYPEAYMVLGDIKYYTRNYKEAMNAYKEALKLDSKSSNAFLKLARLYFLFEKYDKVEANLNKALTIKENEEPLLLKELLNKKSANDYEGLKATAKKLLEKYPKNLIALEILGMALLENEKEKANVLPVLTKIRDMEKQPFLKSKWEKEIEKITNSVAAASKK